MINAVIFDMDGVLIDSEPFWREAEKKVFNEIGVPITDEMCEQIMGVRIDEVVRIWYKKFGWTGPSQAEVATAIVDGVIERVRTRGMPMAGVDKALMFFEERGIPMALATSSGQRLIEAVLDALDLHRRFQIIQSAEKLAFGKPHPEIFMVTAQKLNVEASHCLVFEDSVNGMIAAKAARMRVVAVPDRRSFNDPRFSIADLKLRSLNEMDANSWQKLNGSPINLAVPAKDS